ncbi:MAG: acylphosphatase [Patescibacteria group bacterium]
MPARRFLILGKVQGVFFRAHAKAKADALGITGWVENCPDTSVLIHAEGSEEALKQFQKWCKKGPPAAQVESVASKHAEEKGMQSFEILH